MKNEIDILTEKCQQALEQRNLNDKAHQDRLALELIEVRKQQEAAYLLQLATSGVQVENQHNLLITHLLGVCPDFDITAQPAYTDPEFPDIDTDFNPTIRHYLKDEYTPKAFGEEFVCNIASYGTFGIKSSLIDIARVMGKDHNEIKALTTKLGLKDEEGDPLTWEYLEEQFIKGTAKYKALANYMKANPDVWSVAKRLVSAKIDWSKFNYNPTNPPRRKHGMSMHASGLVISGVPLGGLVPMVVPPGSREKGLQASAWVEGMADTDLSSMGLIKFDYLGLEANARISDTNRLIQRRHNVGLMCALEGGTTWSDTSYLDDPKAIEMANKGDLKGIFQFDSDGIRKMVRAGGVSSFDDLAAYSALYRPGPMDCLSIGTAIKTATGTISIEQLKTWQDAICYFDSQGKMRSTKKYFVIRSGKKKLLKITTKSGKVLFPSADHLILTDHGYVKAGDLKKGQKVATEN